MERLWEVDGRKPSVTAGGESCMTKRKQEAAQALQSIMFLHPFASVPPQTAEERQAVVEVGW